MSRRDPDGIGRRMLVLAKRMAKSRRAEYLADCAEVQAIDATLTPEQRAWLDEQLAAEGLTAEAAAMLKERT